jgi:hypothetical protein
MGLFRRSRKKIGEILVEKGLATKEQVAEALGVQRQLKETKKIQKHVGDILNEKGLITLEDLEFAVAEQKRLDLFIINGLLGSVWRR